MKKVILIILLTLFIPASQAYYSSDGIPFNIAAQGTINGGLYIDGGHGLKFVPYSQEFNIPGGSIRWARLYIGIWGGSEEYEGWVQTELNSNNLSRIELLGVNDDNSNVYCAGHGVYWVYYDITEVVTNGNNIAVIRTSKGEPGNKLDGRVYGAILAALYEDKNAPEITYRLYDGNVNLHGEGWSGKNDNINDKVNINFNNLPGPDSLNSADLTVVYLTGSKGLPDYLQFNEHQLGTTPQYLLDKGYQTGVTDIANEVSGDASSGTGERTSYFDIEFFNVLKYTRIDNNLIFLRGHDLNGDGEIADDEGEDYLHPVIASLVLTHKTVCDPKPDLSIQVEIDDIDLIEGHDVDIPVVIENPGGVCENDFKIRLNVDGEEVSTINAHMDASGVYRSTVKWHATVGDHIIELIADTEDTIQESDENNNIYTAQVKVVARPDLSVTIGEIKKINSRTGMLEASSLLMVLLVFGRLRRKKTAAMALLIVSACLCGCTDNQIITGHTDEYMIPIVITNSGESEASNFDVNLYLDGNRNVAIRIFELAGSSSIEEELSITVVSGEHTIKVTVDEKNYVIESDEENNIDEIIYNFT